MRASEAISAADQLRPNTVTQEQKMAWLMEVDSEMAEMMEKPDPEYRWTSKDPELLVYGAHSNVYTLYLVAQYDSANQDTALYVNDMAMYNAALDDCKAWYRRHHDPNRKQYWKAW